MASDREKGRDGMDRAMFHLKHIRRYAANRGWFSLGAGLLCLAGMIFKIAQEEYLTAVALSALALWMVLTGFAAFTLVADCDWAIDDAEEYRAWIVHGNARVREGEGEL